MGEVYRATDTNLHRDVAIKVLPPEVVQDPERLGRFKREAHLLASLNHPNIAAIYGLEEAEGKPFLALELVEGEDLQERLARGAIPVDEALASWAGGLDPRVSYRHNPVRLGINRNFQQCVDLAGAPLVQFPAPCASRDGCAAAIALSSFSLRSVLGKTVGSSAFSLRYIVKACLMTSSASGPGS